MTVDQVIKELAAMGSEAIKRIHRTHGAKEPFFGVKIGDMKVLHKKIKGDQALAMALYETGNSDAQYLAGMVADGKKMTPAQVQKWAEKASWGMVSNTTVPWVASEHPDGFELAMKWIDSPNEGIACSGWNTLAALAAIIPDDRLPLKKYSALLDRVAKTLKSSPNDVRYTMNGFVISCGAYIESLGEKAIATARKVGPVEVEMAGACKVPEAESYILKCRRGAAVAPKRKSVRC